MCSSEIHQPVSLNCRGRLVDLSTPQVMGIVNVTSDSFFADSRAKGEDELLRMVATHLEAGATFIDIGAMSSRPGAAELSVKAEVDALIPAIESVRAQFPRALISVDVYRGEVAKQALEAGAHMINDIGGGMFDESILEVTGQHAAPYVLMHNRAKSIEMMEKTDYDDVVLAVIDFFFQQTYKAAKAGITDIILDPGIGFSKTVEQNFTVMARLDELQAFQYPLLIGVSRKSFIYKTLKTSPELALNGSTAMHMTALQKGASILRVHDVREAIECITLHNELLTAI